MTRSVAPPNAPTSASPTGYARRIACFTAGCATSVPRPPVPAACATVQDLGLKFVVHRGTFSRYEVAGRAQLHGNDVNLVHRLLKNTVPGHEYLLATATALAAWPESMKSEFIRAPQRYDLGDVDASFLDLRPIRAAVWRPA